MSSVDQAADTAAPTSEQTQTSTLESKRPSVEPKTAPGSPRTRASPRQRPGTLPRNGSRRLSRPGFAGRSASAKFVLDASQYSLSNPIPDDPEERAVTPFFLCIRPSYGVLGFCGFNVLVAILALAGVFGPLVFGGLSIFMWVMQMMFSIVGAWAVLQIVHWEETHSHAFMAARAYMYWILVVLAWTVFNFLFMLSSNWARTFCEDRHDAEASRSNCRLALDSSSAILAIVSLALLLHVVWIVRQLVLYHEIHSATHVSGGKSEGGKSTVSSRSSSPGVPAGVTLTAVAASSGASAPALEPVAPTDDTSLA